MKNLEREVAELKKIIESKKILTYPPLQKNEIDLLFLNGLRNGLMV